MDYQVREFFSPSRPTGNSSLSPQGCHKRAGRSHGKYQRFPMFPQKNWNGFLCAPQASAATVSAQVSTFVRIASSEYEVRFTRSRANVTM
jgi:hypothetical protein